MSAAAWASLEEPRARVWAFLALLAAAVLSPNIGMPDPAPAVRLEQLLLAALLPSFAAFLWRHPEARRRTKADWAFSALACAIAVTLVYAPLAVDGASFSFRDPFEVARVAEYWLLYRFALVLPADRLPRAGAMALLCAAALGEGAFALVQYLEPPGFNETVTAVWAAEHHLRALDRTGRAVGTVGNANYFGIFSALLLFAALAALALRAHPLWLRRLALAAVPAAVLCLVLSQSRSATFAAIFGLTVGFGAAVLMERGRARFLQPAALFLASAAVAITFVELVPPDYGSYHARFAPQEITGGSSTLTRISRWRSLFAGFFETRPTFCETGEIPGLDPAPGHEPTAELSAAPEDARRRADVRRLARAVLDYFCEHERWPAGAPLAEALVPDFLAEMPRDPAGEPYLAYVASGGFLVGAELGDPSSPDGPIYTLGTIPNMVRNPSFESVGSVPSWVPVRGASLSATRDERLFGERAALLAAEGSALVYQSVVFTFPRERPYTVSLWAKSAGGAQELELYLVAGLVDGTTLDPFERAVFGVPDDGRWHRFWLSFDTGAVRIDRLQIVLRPAGDAPLRIYVDGVALNEGSFPASFATVSDVDPARLNPQELPTFADSPVFGVGPLKELQLGAVDNEYALFLDRYGIVGAAAYVALYLLAGAALWRAARFDERGRPLALALLAFLAGLFLFDVAAGSFYHFQIMAVFWLLVGLAARGAEAAREGSVRA